MIATLFERAHADWDSGNHELAFARFSQCAEDGDVSCMLNLGYFHDEGIGTSTDKARALYWYKRAYRKGCVAAATNIAILYRESGKARLCYQWFARAAKRGDGDAELELAKLSAQGIGVRRSMSSARAALMRAQQSDQITPAGKEEVVALSAELRNAR